MRMDDKKVEKLNDIMKGDKTVKALEKCLKGRLSVKELVRVALQEARRG